ncbi:hypothetical protein EOD42_14460 [Rhodovarius crocodyli]|uniref:Uncharacterized protein n=2 Tax=Rhodovarius crocodyli TaxID=1979269 RepID=A0A437MFL7_9PROT|nr:hypothetical protein EOD42_14460 [Rhodovarius crocodyli]
MAHPRVTKEHIEAQIMTVDYIYEGQLTICIISMKNGFRLVGKSAPADPANFNAEVGQRYAYEDAFRQAWPLEGYLLCTVLQTQKEAGQ